MVTMMQIYVEKYRERYLIEKHFQSISNNMSLNYTYIKEQLSIYD